jgi:hypothetical protein
LRSKKRVESKEETKKFNVEEYIEEVLIEDNSRIRYCELEKCKIITEEGF